MSYDVTKLPKWAQSEIARLESNVADYKKMAYAVTTSEEEQLPISNTEVAQGFDKDSKYLPPDTTVRFHGDAGWLDVTVSKRGIEVHAQDPLKVKPQSSNSIYIEVERWT